MSMVKYFGCIVLLHSVAIVCYAQNDGVSYVVPSPEAATLMEYSSVPVSYYTGLPQIEVPLCELKGRVSSVPVSLSYHASGVKVQDISGSVGLSWALQAGGTVTRIVRGLPDESPNGYSNLNFTAVMNDWQNVEQGVYDTEPDIYAYSFQGFSGKFVLDNNGSAIQLPERDLQITPPDFSSSNPTWIITDTRGIKYVFGKTSSSRETTSSKLQQQPSASTKTYISSWYLAEITYPTGQEVVTFTYLSGSNVYYETYQQTLFTLKTYAQPGCTPPGFSFPSQNTNTRVTEITVNNPKYLSQITSSLGTVTFTYQPGRQDLTNGLRLENVKLKNYLNDVVREFNLINNDYFVSSGCADSNCKRLKLNKIIDVTNGASTTYREFLYNTSELLPGRASVKYDTWGYYNNNTYSSAIPSTLDKYGVSHPGADKAASASRSQANMLTAIINQAGGMLKFYYELHDYYKNGQNNLAGGVRIKKIVEDDGAGNTITRNFAYKSGSTSNSSGILFRKFVDHYEVRKYYYCTDYQVYGYRGLNRYSSSPIDLFDTGGTHVGYSEVQVNYSDGSQEKLFYHNFDSRPDDAPAFVSPPGETDPDFTNPDGPPFVSTGDRSFERGLLKEHLILNSTRKKLKRLVNEYDFYEVSSGKIQGGRLMLLWDQYGVKKGRKGTYKYAHRGVRPLRTIEEDYDQSDDNKVHQKETSYTYFSEYTTSVRSKVETMTNGDQYKTEFLYAFSIFDGTPYSSGDSLINAYYSMHTDHITDSPVGKVASLKRNGASAFQFIGGDFSTYKINSLTGNAKVFQKYVLSLSIPTISCEIPHITSGGFYFDTRWELRQMSKAYNEFDNLLSETVSSGITYSYTWGHNNSLVTSIVKTSGALQESQSIQYKPLIGPTTITDANNRNTFYEYDQFNRLKIVRDHESNMLKKFEYRFVND